MDVNLSELLEESRRILEVLDRVRRPFLSRTLPSREEIFEVFQSNLPCQAQAKNAALPVHCPGHIVEVDLSEVTQPWVIPCPCALTKRRFSYTSLGFVLARWTFPTRESLQLIFRSRGQQLAWIENSEAGSLQAALCGLLFKWWIFESMQHTHKSSASGNTRVGFGSQPTLVFPVAHAPPRLSQAQIAARAQCEMFLAVESLFASKSLCVLPWEMVRSAYYAHFAGQEQRALSRQQVIDSLHGRRLCVLALDDKQMQMKSGVNPEVNAFEEFIADVARSHVGLVVFALQPLIRPPNSEAGILDFDYAVDTRESYRDEKNRLRFVSKRARLKPQGSLQDCLRVGSFDRLAELLALGQEALDAMEVGLKALHPGIPHHVK